jgi:hypothetical protein
MNKDPALLKGEDLIVNGVYSSFTLTIESAQIVTRENENVKKEGLLIQFAKAHKPLFCPVDQVNYRMIKAELGSIDCEKLVGKKLTIIPVRGDWFGEKNTLGLRVLVTGERPKPSVKKKVFGESIVGLKILEDK